MLLSLAGRDDFIFRFSFFTLAPFVELRLISF
jgi:hypothetical protein